MNIPIQLKQMGICIHSLIHFLHMLLGLFIFLFRYQCFNQLLLYVNPLTLAISFIRFGELSAITQSFIHKPNLLENIPLISNYDFSSIILDYRCYSFFRLFFNWAISQLYIIVLSKIFFLKLNFFYSKNAERIKQKFLLLWILRLL